MQVMTTSQVKPSHQKPQHGYDKNELNSQTKRFTESKHQLSVQISEYYSFINLHKQKASKQSFIGQLFHSLIQKQEKRIGSKNIFKPSLISQTKSIKKLMGQNKILNLIQTVGRSEIIALIVGILIEMNDESQKVILYTSQSTIQSYRYYCDVVLLYKINQLQIRCFEDENMSFKDLQKSLVIVDLFYSPKLISTQIIKTIQNGEYKHLSIYSQRQYHTHLGEQVHLSQNFPVQIIHKVQIKQIILQILQKSKLYTQKADIIIFSSNFRYQCQIIKDIIKSTKNSVNIINGIEPQHNNLVNIFIAQDQKQLSSWKYCYDNVLAVFDYGQSIKTRFDPKQKAFIQTIKDLSSQQVQSRIFYLGRTKPGKYFKMYSYIAQKQSNQHYEDLSAYVLRMISMGKTKQQILNGKSPKVKKLIQDNFNFLKQQQIIKDKDIVSGLRSYYCSPFYINVLNKVRDDSIKSNLLLYIISILNFNCQIKLSQSHIFSKINKKQGDVSLFVEIMYLYELANNQSKPVSKQNKPEQKQKQVDKLLTLFDISENIVKKCVRKINILRDIYDVSFTQISNFKEAIQSVFVLLGQNFSNLYTYTGSKKIGYRSPSNYYLLDKSNIFSIFNQRPTFIFPLKLIRQKKSPLHIYYSEKITQQNYILIAGQTGLAVRKSSMDDKQIEFLGLSNALVERFWNTNILQQFQKQHVCTYQLNKEQNNLYLYCQTNKQKIEVEFRQLMSKIEFQLQIGTKVIDYNIWKLVFEKGGIVKELLSSNEYKICNLINIPSDTPNQRVVNFLEEYADFENIKVSYSPDAKTKIAKLTFISSADLRWVVMELNRTMFDGNVIEFVKQQKDKEDKRMISETNIIFKWYTWPLTKAGTGIVTFKTRQQAMRAAEAFDTQFDNKIVTPSVQQNRLHLSGLNEHTDQTFLQSRLSVYGEIQHIQLQKQRTQQFDNAERMINYLIYQHVDKGYRFHIQNVKKMSDGERIAKVKVFSEKLVPTLCNQLNESIGSLGKTRLYLQPQFKLPILVRDPKTKRLYEDLLNQCVKQLNINSNSVKIELVQNNNLQYFVIQTKNQNALTLTNNLFFSKLRGQIIKLTSQLQDLLFSNIGPKSLIDIEFQYDCKFIISINQKQFRVVCRKNDYEKIAKYIQKLPSIFRQQVIECSSSKLKIINKNSQILDKLKSSYKLNVLYNKISKCITLQGEFRDIVKAKVDLLKYFENFDLQNTEQNGMCGICCQFLTSPYKLQSCNHLFCQECLLYSIQNSLSDINCFPIKCPHCLVPIIIEDLNLILDTIKWDKLINISLNKFITQNSDVYKFCLTPNCDGICLLRKDIFDCKLCQKSYCNLCNMEEHPECTCYEAKIGFKALLQKFIQENDVRICPNNRCKMLMQKISGCNKVLCCRCNKSVCWKCPKQKMAYYETPRQCYDHLNSVHGGYS